MRVLGISGSLRRDSYNTRLLRHAGELFASDGVEFEIYQGLRDVPPYNEDDDIEGAPEAVSRIRETVRAADAVFFMGARVAEGEVAVGRAMDRFDANGRLSEPNLEEEVREVASTLIAEAKGFPDLDPLAA